MNDNTTPQAEIDARARWEAEKEKADSPLDAEPCSACGGSGLGPAMYRPEIDKTQRDRCYTCKGTGTKPPTKPITVSPNAVAQYIASIKKEHERWSMFRQQAADHRQPALVARYGDVCDALKMAINQAEKILRPNNPTAITLDQLARHLIYGDIEEMTLSILGDDCPSDEQFAGMDQEQRTRLAAAATVLACLQGRLHPKGYLMPKTFPPVE